MLRLLKTFYFLSCRGYRLRMRKPIDLLLELDKCSNTPMNKFGVQAIALVKQGKVEKRIVVFDGKSPNKGYQRPLANYGCR